MLPHTYAMSDSRHGDYTKIVVQAVSATKCSILDRNVNLCNRKQRQSVIKSREFWTMQFCYSPTRAGARRHTYKIGLSGSLGMCFNDNVKRKIVSCARKYTGVVVDCAARLQQPINCSPWPPRPLHPAFLLEYKPENPPT